METTPVHVAHRSERIAVLAVGGLSILAGALYLWAIFAIFLPDAEASASRLGYAVFVGMNTAAAGLLWWHRRYPVRVFAAILGVYIVSALTTGITDVALTLALWFSVFALTAYAPLIRAWIALATGWVLAAAMKVYLAVALGYGMTLAEVGLIVVVDVGFFFVACGVLGLGFRFQHQRAQEAAERARLLEEHARALHAEATATERNRLARDLHDLAAHELMDALLSIRALQISSDDPILPEIEQKTARALENMRTVVRTLRADDAHGDPARLPLADAATQVIDTLRAERGIEVTPTISAAGPVDDACTSTVLSVLKETVLNAARHAPGMPVTVALDSSPSDVQLTVTNPTSPSGSQETGGTGYGLVGAAERAKLLGGTFDAHQTESGDWIATLHLPLTAAPAEPTLIKETR